MPAVSDRVRNIGTEQAFAVLAEVNGLKAKGRDIVSFCIGQPDFRTPENVCVEAKKAIDEGKHGYTGSAGIPELRKAVADHEARSRGVKFSQDEVVIAAGAKPIISYAVMAATDHSRGCEVIYPKPGYPIYESQVIFHGAKPVPIFLREKNEFNFDVEELRERVSRKTALLIINTPQNPTGGVLGDKELKAIADLANDYDFWILSDEVYAEIVYDGEFKSIVSYAGMKERTILMDGVSKSHAMTGWRIGYALNKALAPYFTTLVTNTESCAGHLNQWAAVEALLGPQESVKKMVAAFKERRDLIVEGLNSIEGVSCLKPKGAFYVFPNVTEACKMVGARDSEGLRKRLLNEAGVAVLADTHFGTKVPGEGEHLRFSYAASTEEIREGLKRIEDFVEKNSK